MNIAYSDARIVKLGRWQDTGSGVWSGFGSSQLRFKVSGTASVTINANVICTVGKSCFGEGVIDNSPEKSVLTYFANNENFTGARSVTYTLPDTGEHEINIKVPTKPLDNFNSACKCTVTSITLDTGAVLSAPSLGVKLLQCVGDSWMGAENDYPRLMDSNLWKPYQIAGGGFTAADLNAQYNYMSTGVAATDPVADAVIVGFSINEYNQNIAVSTFQSNLLALVDKIKAKQSCPVILTQLPRNLVTGKQFDKYGVAMQNIVAIRSNVFFIPSTDMWDKVTWISDGYHLDAAGKRVWAYHVSSNVKSIIGISYPYLRVGGAQFTGDNVITDSHALRYHGAISVGFELGLSGPLNIGTYSIMGNA